LDHATTFMLQRKIGKVGIHVKKRAALAATAQEKLL